MATYWENSCSFGLRYVSWYKYLIVGLVFSRLGFWSGNLFLIAPFPDLCLLVPLDKDTYEQLKYSSVKRYLSNGHACFGTAWSVCRRQVCESARHTDTNDFLSMFFCWLYCNIKNVMFLVMHTD